MKQKRGAAQMPPVGTEAPISAETESEVVGGSGYGTLQRKINETGEVKV
jgi:hypothetical protein